MGDVGKRIDAEFVITQHSDQEEPRDWNCVKCEPLGTEIFLMDGACVIQKKKQKRVAYFDCTAAPGDSSVDPSHAGPPFSSLPALLVRPHSRHVMVDVSDWRRSSGQSLRTNEHPLQTR